MSLFHFLRPEWFIAIIPLVLLLWLLRRLHLKNRSWQSFCDQGLLPHLLQQTDLQQKKRPLSVIFIAGLITIFALAGPSWEKRPQPVFKKQSALVIILDLSLSMDATDIKPSRLKRALHKIEDILHKRTEGQTALIVYAGDAFTVTPLTEDSATISSQVKSLSTSIIPTQGSRTDKALQLAHNLFKQTSLYSGHILLITDGINDKAIDTAESLLANQYTLSVLGVGTNDGSPIPLETGGFFKDSSGAIVIPKLNQKKLHQLALTSSGAFRLLSIDDSDINFLLKPLDSRLNNNQDESTELNTDSWFEFGPWLLLAVLPLAAFAFRRGYLFILIIMILPHSEPSYAADDKTSAGTSTLWDSLWKNNNQQAKELLLNNNASAAAEQFSDRKWKAAAEYKAGQYQKALESYQQLDSANPENLYNIANTQAQLGQLNEALENYNKVLQKKPDHADAKHNRDAIEKMMQEQEQQDNKEQKDGDQKSDKKDSKNKDSDSKDQDSSDSKSDQQNSSNENNEEKKQDSKESQSKDGKKPQDNEDNNSEEQQQSEAQKNDDEDKNDSDNQEQPGQLSKEQQQANEQWLRRIPDDPGGLLKRKFKYQSEQRNNTKSGEQQW